MIIRREHAVIARAESTYRVQLVKVADAVRLLLHLRDTLFFRVFENHQDFLELDRAALD